MKTIKLFLLIAVLSISTVVLGQPYYKGGVDVRFKDKITGEMVTYKVNGPDPGILPHFVIKDSKNTDDGVLYYTNGTKSRISENAPVVFSANNWDIIKESLYKAFGQDLVKQVRRLMIGVGCVADNNGNVVEVSFDIRSDIPELTAIPPQKLYDAERLIKKNLKFTMDTETKRYRNPSIRELVIFAKDPETISTSTYTDPYDIVYVKNRYQYSRCDIISVKRRQSEFVNTIPTYTNKTPIPTELVQNATIGYVFIKECMPAELLARLKAANKEMTINFAISQLGYLMDLEFVFDNDALMAEIPMSVFADIYLRTEFKTLSAPVLGLQSNISYTTGSKVIKFKDIN